MTVTDTNTFTIGCVLAAWSIFMLVVLSITWRKALQEARKNRANRLIEYQARVLDRRDSAGSRFILFEYNGRQIEHIVSDEVFEIARVGRQGILCIRAGQCESFEPLTETHISDDVYDRMVSR